MYVQLWLNVEFTRRGIGGIRGETAEVVTQAPVDVKLLGIR